MDSQADHFVTMLENYKVHSQLPLSLPCFFAYLYCLNSWYNSGIAFCYYF